MLCRQGHRARKSIRPQTRKIKLHHLPTWCCGLFLLRHLSLYKSGGAAVPIAGGAKDFPGASGCRGSPGPPAAGAAKGRRRHPPPKRRPAAGLFFVFPVSGVGGYGFCFLNPSGVFFVPSPGCFVRSAPHGAKAAYGPGRGAPDRGGPGPVRARSPARDAKKAPRRLFRVPGPGPEMNTRGYRQRPAPVAARPGAPADPRGPGPGPHNGPAHALRFFFFFLGVLPGSVAFPVLASSPPLFTPSTLLPPFLPRYPTRRGRPGVVQQRRRVSR